MQHVVRAAMSPRGVAGVGGVAPGHFISPAALLRLQAAVFHDQIALDAYCERVVRTGSVLIKYSTQGRQIKRWFYVQDSPNDVRLCWCQPKTKRNKSLQECNPNGLSTYQQNGKHTEEKESIDTSKKSTAALSSRRSILPSFTIGSWKFNHDRSRSMLDALSIHYGSFYSETFCRFLEKHAHSTNTTIRLKPWLCFSIQFPDRTIDLQCENEWEVTAWFLGLQSISPMTPFHLTRGMLLWQRLIMKMNYYGLPQIKRVLAKRAAAASAAASTGR